MAELLSAPWLEELAARLESAGPLHAPGATLRLGQLVSDAPGGAVSWTIVLADGQRVRVEPGIERAQVVLVEDLATARALAGGVPAAELLRSGRIKLRGDVAALRAADGALAALGELLGAP